MEQFKVTFVEESLEGLDIMETMLLDLEPASDDDEAINTIFRAAHSIKGGAATFGFSVIADFTHVMETLLDEIRNKDREITQAAIELFLESVDCLRMLMNDTDPGADDLQRVADLKKSLEVMLGNNDDAASTTDTTTDTEPQKTDSIAGWEIQFRPHSSMLKTGNDVVRMFRELAELGEFEVEVDTSGLPVYEQLEPESSYLSWHISLRGNIDKALIDDVFAWVDGECDLDITAVADKTVAETIEETSAQTVSEDNVDKPSEQRTATAATDSTTKTKTKKATQESASIRVGIEKVDDLINMVGELVITQSMLSQLGKAEIDEFDIVRIEKMREGLAQLERNTRELQESVMRIRMMPISFAFNRFPRMVHDMCRKLGKKIELKVSGEATELDKTVMEKIGDPLVHIVRNSCDHGIESPEKRLAAGKPETGTVQLEAYHQGGDIVIKIIDDGAGLNKQRIYDKAVKSGIITAEDKLSEEQIFDLLFMPGFSTAETVTDVSGRGVGMDVVKRNVQALGGRVDVQSQEGIGSTFTIRLPLTLAILDGQLIRVGKEVYIVPLVSIIESMQLKTGMVRQLTGSAEVYRLRNEYLPVIRLYDTFDIDTDSTVLTDGLVVVVESGNGKKAGIYVDDLLDQQQVVIKSLETNFKTVQGISGATILGDGTVALILDVASLIMLAHNKVQPNGLRQLTAHVQAA